MVEKFNTYFTTVGKKLADKINTPHNAFRKFVKPRVTSTMFLEPARSTKIYNYIHSLGLHKSSRHDNIDSYFIRVASDAITPHLTQLCHLSFEFGIFPNALKIAKIIPVFKCGRPTKTEVNNYRPISLLSNFSKILAMDFD